MNQRGTTSLLMAGLAILGGCQSVADRGPVPAPDTLRGRWQLQALQGEQVSDQSRAFIEFSDPPRLTGNGGCNRFFGVYEYRPNELFIDSALGSTKIACAPQVMVEEQRLFQLLPRAVMVERVADNELVLHDTGGDELIRVKKLPGGHL